ncbi:hypothetical protein I0C86_32690 [Plantactinospora sp. S1510]|uniref:Uncharacterized protein n=1 Tax=Plantactinospora alkalitolerans TaxID=2789879 RepID=A0ABS0H635_9ACTN|nr:hypothetical protein [Plantactinospora alkalitolerans]MBF9133658.1 hypothetical protein [Plantactinospora alkalitolerans]
MTRFRSALIVAGAALTATALLPSAPASADTVTKYVHILFESQDSNAGMDLDVTSAAGRTTIDVDWADNQCRDTESGRTCDFVFRNSDAVPVRRFSFSFDQGSFSTRLPYQETRRTCTYANEEEVSCTEDEYASGVTTIDVTWTGSSEPTRSRRTDEDGRVHVTTSANAAVSGTAHGLTYGGPLSLGWLSRVRIIDPQS